jgi:hypothetical protein
MMTRQASARDAFYLAGSLLAGAYFTLLGLPGLIFGADARWGYLLPLALGCTLLWIAGQRIRIGLTTRTLLPPRVQADPLPGGVELEAEIVGRFESGAVAGSELAKARESWRASWDPLELELRYVFEGTEIVSRRRVSFETFFHTRGMRTLKIKVLPGRPDRWVALS